MNNNLIIIYATIGLNGLLFAQLLLMAGVTVEKRPFMRFLFCISWATISAMTYFAASELAK